MKSFRTLLALAAILTSCTSGPGLNKKMMGGAKIGEKTASK